MRVARREALLNLGVEDRRSGQPLELLVRAAAAGWRVVELDVSDQPRDGRQVEGQRFTAGQHHCDLPIGKVICDPVAGDPAGGCQGAGTGPGQDAVAATVGDRVAADIAAAALLDTLDAVASAPVAARVVALTGDLDGAAAATEIRHRFEAFTVIEQRGDSFADRLANANCPRGLRLWGVSGAANRDGHPAGHRRTAGQLRGPAARDAGGVGPRRATAVGGCSGSGRRRPPTACAPYRCPGQTPESSR